MDTVKDINRMSYVEFMALLGEINRPPGGKDSVRVLLQNTFLSSDSKVLDIGCNTGFVAFEISSLVGCHVTGIDVSEKMLSSANDFLKKYYRGLKRKVDFVLADAVNLPFPDNFFDLVVSGGSTAFISDISKALKEYTRVVKPWRFIGDINFYFHTPPPDSLVDKINELMGTDIQKWNIDYWLNKYREAGLEIYYAYEDEMSPVTDKEISEYSAFLVERKDWPDKVKRAARDRLVAIYRLFNEEHKYLAYGVFILRKRTYKETILF